MQVCQLYLNKSVTAETVLQEADITRIALSVASKYHSKLLVPDDNFYVQSPSEDDARDILKKLQHHIGLKHSSLQLFVDINDPEVLRLELTDTPKIVLGLGYLRNSFVLTEVIAHVFCHYLVASKHHVTLTDTVSLEDLVDITAIQIGFGILLANGRVQHVNSDSSRGMETTSFWENLSRYLQKNYVPHGYWQYSAFSSVEQHLGYRPSKQKARFITDHNNEKGTRRWKMWSFVAIVVMLISSLLVISYAASQRENLQNRQDKLQQIQALQDQLITCSQSAHYKQSTWDTNDIFIDRTINGEQLTCKQIKNKYENLQRATD